MATTEYQREIRLVNGSALYGPEINAWFTFLSSDFWFRIWDLSLGSDLWFRIWDLGLRIFFEEGSCECGGLENG